MLNILDDQFQSNIEGSSIVEQKPSLRELFLALPNGILWDFIHKFHVNGVIWLRIKGDQPGPIELSTEVLAKSVIKSIVWVVWLLAWSEKKANFILLESTLWGVFLGDLPHLLSMGRFLQIFFHEVLEMERFMIQTFRKVFP